MLGVTTNPISPEPRVAASIREQLLAGGCASGEIEELPVTVAEWRQPVRAVGREFGTPLNTSIVRSTVCATLRR